MLASYSYRFCKAEAKIGSALLFGRARNATSTPGTRKPLRKKYLEILTYTLRHTVPGDASK